MSTLDNALALAARGYPVFPCRPDKRPATAHGFKDAARDPDTIRDLWRRSPGDLIGVPTGDVSGIDALDIDPRHGGDDWLRDAADSLPVTRRHVTQSGGTHILFRHAKDVRNSAGKVGPGVDVRGDGGYIVWWPAAGHAVTQPDTIESWPRWLLKLIVPPPRPLPPPVVPATKAEADVRALLMIERAFARVRHAAPGQRHYELRAAAATLGGLLRFMPEGPGRLQQQLVDLIMSTGAEDRRNAERTAAWALDRGHASPLLQGR